MFRPRKEVLTDSQKHGQRLSLRWAVILGAAVCAAIAAFAASGFAAGAVTAVTVAGGLHLIIE